MKKLISALVATTFIFWGGAKAKAEYPYQGTQIQTNLHYKPTLIPKKLDLKLSVMYITTPDTKTHTGFAYAGVEVPIGDSFWIGPRFGVAMNWGDKFPAIVSLTLGASLAKGKLALLAIAEGYFCEGMHDFYGYYEAGVKLVKWLTFGVQAEQINKTIMFGPHLLLHYKTFTVGAQYYFGAQPEVMGHALRIFIDFMIPS